MNILRKYSRTLLFLFFSGYAYSSTSASITQSMVYPRINIINNEDVLSQTQIRLTQSLLSLGELKIDFAYTTPAISPWENLQVYNFSFKSIKKHNLQFEFGRIVNWNPVYTLRVDGARTDIFTSLGKFTWIGGYKFPDLYNSDKSFQTNTHFIEWKIKRKYNSLSLSSWIVNQRKSQDFFMGISLRKRIFGNFNSNGYAVWDFTNQQIQKLRFRISKKLLSNHTIFMDVRARSYTSSDPYPWSNKKIKPRSALALGHRIRLKPALNWSNSIVKGIGKTEPDFRYRTSLQAANIRISISTEKHNKSNSLGGSVSARKIISKRIYAGSSLFYRSYTFNDDFHAFNTTGASVWLNFQFNSHFHLRLTSDFYQNRYFNQDGRGSLIINYVP